MGGERRRGKGREGEGRGGEKREGELGEGRGKGWGGDGKGRGEESGEGGEGRGRKGREGFVKCCWCLHCMLLPPLQLCHGPVPDAIFAQHVYSSSTADWCGGETGRGGGGGGV